MKLMDFQLILENQVGLNLVFKYVNIVIINVFCE